VCNQDHSFLSSSGGVFESGSHWKEWKACWVQEMCNDTTNTISSCSKNVEQALKNSTGVQIGLFYIDL
jgi:hypothetical protein